MGDAGGVGLYLPFTTVLYTAQAVRDYVEYVGKKEDAPTEPWALGLARRCYDMAGGQLLHLPFSGGAWEQDEMLMCLIGIARQAWYVFKFMPVNEMKWGEAEAGFIAWVADEKEDGQD